MRWVGSLFFAACWVAGCGSSPKGVDLGGPPIGAVYQSQVFSDGTFYVSAKFREDHERELRRNLIDDERILPIWLELEVQSSDQGDNRRVNPEQWNMRLFLQDGTVLSHLSRATVTDRVGSSEVRARIEERDLEGGLIGAGEKVEGFVFFEIPDDDGYVFLDRRRMARTSRGRSKTVELGRSLLAFEVQDRNSNTRTVYVGLTY